MQIFQSKSPSDSSCESSSFRKQLLEFASPPFLVSKPFKRAVIEPRRLLIRVEEIKHHWTPLSLPPFPVPTVTHTSFCYTSYLSHISSWLPLSLALSKNEDLRVMPGWRREFIHFYACVYCDPWLWDGQQYCITAVGELCAYSGGLCSCLAIDSWKYHLTRCHGENDTCICMIDMMHVSTEMKILLWCGEIPMDSLHRTSSWNRFVDSPLDEFDESI